MTVADLFVREKTSISPYRAATGASSMPSSRRRRVLMMGMDTLFILLAFVLAIVGTSALRTSALATPQTGTLLVSAGLGVGWLVVLRVAGTYSKRHLTAGADEYKRVLNASLAAAGVFGIACFMLNYDYPRLTFGLWISIGIIALCVGRYARRHTLQKFYARGMLLTPVLVAGSDHHVDAVAIALKRASWSGYKIVGAVTREDRPQTATGLPVLGMFDDVVNIIKSKGIETVIFAEGSFASPSDFRRLAWELEECRVQMMVVPTMADVGAERLNFSPMAGLPLVSVGRPRALNSLRWTKRAADVIGSAILLVLAAPVLLLTALAIKLEDGGPVIFRQKRVGLKGEEFYCLKLRSMSVDAEARIAALQAKNEGAGVLFKMANDPRVTRVGRFIRRFSVDELPQLMNTLKGDMSLVGPRPALPREVAQYDDDTMRRLHVRPGLTGLWQVSGRSNLSWDDTVRLDLYYVDNWSLVRDIMILAKTAKAVLGSSGAY